MGRKLRHFGCITLLIGGAVFGCHKSAVQHKEPPDPLLVSKPPIDGKARTAHSSPLAHRESPPPPPMPADADTADRTEPRP